MFGIGGGLITTPAIRVLLGAPALIALGTPLPVIIPTAISGAISHARHGTADVRAGAVVGLAGAAPAVLGAWLSALLGGRVMMLLTAVLLAYVGFDTVRSLRRRGSTAETGEPGTPGADAPPPPHAARERVEGEERSTWRLLSIGAVAGLYSGLLGLGGGFVIVPLLSRWLGFPFKRAIGTSLVAVAFLAVPGTLAHAALGHVDWRMALGLAIGGVPGAVIGARLTARASVRAVRVGFAALLVLAAVSLTVTELVLRAR